MMNSMAYQVWQGNFVIQSIAFQTKHRATDFYQVNLSPFKKIKATKGSNIAYLRLSDCKSRKKNVLGKHS